MLNIRIVCVGRLKESWYKAACAEYLKRMGGMYSAEVIEIPEKSLPKNPSQTQISEALRDEGARITERISGFAAALCVEAAPLSSEDLAEKLEEWSMSDGAASFVIGGSFGLDERLKSACGFRFSMSRMTFPHHLARVMLIEQIYRAGCINSGRKYHK